MIEAGRYFDHAATSFPKSAAVVDAVTAYLRQEAGNPGRGAHSLANAAARTLMQARVEAARVFGRAEPERVLFTASATEALNAVIGELVGCDAHVVTTMLEHNAVARPLARAAEAGAEITKLHPEADGTYSPAQFAAAVRPDTRAVVVTGGSNVLGVQVPVSALREAIGARPWLIVDAAQIAGVQPIDMDRWGVDALAVPGHKGLGGPQGVGLLLASDRLALAPWREGGTGGHSEAPRTPAVWPEGFEAGTPNGPGVAGLLASLRQLDDAEIDRRTRRVMASWEQLVTGLAAIPGVRIASRRDADRALPIVAFLIAGQAPGEVAYKLGQRGFAVRAGLHCAPDAHRLAGSLSQGLVRASLGTAHSRDDVDALVAAVGEIATRAA